MAEIHEFDSFCRNSVQGLRPFREKIHAFIQEFGEPQNIEMQEMRMWSTKLKLEGIDVVVPLYTIEEDVKKSRRPRTCDHCRVTGWTNHLLCKRKYYIIIPVEERWKRPIGIDADALLDIQNQNHLLCGLIHSDGYGHLLSIRGRQGGSTHLSGKEIMNLWDRICTHLGTRAISVKDISQRAQIDLRLLHGVAYDRCWFGQWGYNHSHGSYGVNHAAYMVSLSKMQSLKLSQIMELFDGSTVDRPERVKELMTKYKTDELKRMTEELKRITHELKRKTDQELETEADKLKSKIKTLRDPEASEFKDFLSYLLDNVRLKTVGDIKEKPKCSREKIEQAVGEAMAVLNAHQGSMFRVDLRARIIQRGTVRAASVLDTVLRRLHNVVFNDTVFIRSKSTPLSYILQPLEEVNAYRDADLQLIYQQVMLSFPQIDGKKNDSVDGELKVAAESILDCKHFVKQFADPPIACSSTTLKELGDQLAFQCHIVFPFDWTSTDYSPETDHQTKKDSTLSPSEMVVLRNDATIGELKKAAQTAFRDTYCIAQDFEVLDIVNCELRDEELVSSLGRNQVGFTGMRLDLSLDWRYQAGNERKVRCKCFADREDGERMIECNNCNTWCHTLCFGIQDDDPIPGVFWCSKCFQLLFADIKSAQEASNDDIDDDEIQI